MAYENTVIALACVTLEEFESYVWHISYTKGDDAIELIEREESFNENISRAYCA